jgi:hypothetical protein
VWRRGERIMPRGIFLLGYNETKIPEIKCFYYKVPLNLPSDLIFKLYTLINASFNASSLLEMKYDHYRIIACFSGQNTPEPCDEGVLGIILEEHEIIENLELFLRRNLSYSILHPTDPAMEEIFKIRLLNFINLNNIFTTRFEIENIPEILIINGDTEYKSNLLRIGEMQVSNTELEAIYKKMINNQEVSQFSYCKLDLSAPNITYLLMKYEKYNPNIDKILSIMKPYIERYFYYSLEIIALFLLAPVLTLTCLHPESDPDPFDSNKSLVQILRKSKNYNYDFNNLIPLILNNEIYLASMARFDY